MQTPRVRDLMSSPAIAVPRTTRLPAIKRLMREHKIRHLPVVDAGRLVGIISLGDVRNAFPSDTTILSIYELSYLLDKVTAGDILRTDVITIAPQSALAEAARLMLEHRVSSLPVLEEDHLIGIITGSDILRAVIAGEVGLPTSASTAL